MAAIGPAVARKAIFAGQRTLLRTQSFVFEGFEFGGDETLGIFQRLAAAVVVGHLVHLALGDFDEKTMHFVELHAQIGNASARLFAHFQVK